MNRQLRWDDLRTILAIAEAGSLSGAGRRLGKSHPTVFRHLGDIEARLGVALFDRGRNGYTPTAAGEEATKVARRVEREVLDLERRVAGQDLRPSGTVRMTTTDSLLTGLLSPLLAAFHRTYPEITLEVAVSNEVFNLTRREADVALRPSSLPPETLVGRKVGVVAQAIYISRDLPSGVSLQSLDWVGPDERMAYHALNRWMTDQGLDARCRYRLDTVLGMVSAVADGAGAAVLPCYLADQDPRLVRIGDPVDALATDLWLLTHPDLRRTARIRAFMDFVAERVRSLRTELAGED